MKPIPLPRAAFSLVEVTLALGVAAFCLVSIFGLMTVGLNSNYTAIEQTAANGILSMVSADLRATPSTLPAGGATVSRQLSIPIPGNPVDTAPAATTLYFTSEGQLSAPEGSRYRLTITFPPNGSNAKTAIFVNLQVTWPAMASLTDAAGSVRTFVALDRN